jgi:hypothetical protein
VAVLWIDYVLAAHLGGDDFESQVTVHTLPAINASLNALSGVLLVIACGVLLRWRIDLFTVAR